MTSEHDRRSRSPGDSIAALPRFKTVATFSRRVARTPNIAALLGAEHVAFFPLDLPFRERREIDAVVTRRDSRTAARAGRFARSRELPLWTLDDGFIRSVDSGAEPLSLILDDVGCHDDARGPSRVESLLSGAGAAADPSDPLADPALLERAEALIETMRQTGVSRLNDAPPTALDLDEQFGEGPRVLILDQPVGDPSIAAGLAGAETFASMVAAAECDHPGAQIIIWRDPESTSSAPGHLEHAVASRITGSCVPMRLFEQVDAVYTATARIGFEAVLCGAQTVCFGSPFYAGWGITDDRAPACVRRARDRSPAQVFAAAYLLASRYADPNAGGEGRAEDVVAHLALQRREFERNRGKLFCVGFHSWKQRTMRRYLRSPGNQIIFANTAGRAARLGFDESSRLITWGQRGDDAAVALMEKFGVPRWRIEDAFLRSVGLGSDITTPASLVLDREGIYYDPRTPSELERIIESGDYTDEDVARAASLRERIVEARLSKYNVGRDRAIETPEGARVVLVPGQVADDASVQLGCVDICTNAGLLEAARAAAPDAYVIFKPHPDVVSGNRDGMVSDQVARRYADRIIDDVSLADCLAASDEVHTMTSLVGFEALLRGLRVVVYGQPFYAGWGLTEDRHRIPRRSKRLTIDELSAAALIRYPRYLHPVTARFTTPEAILDHLAAARDSDTSARTVKVSWPRRQARKLGHILRELTRAP